MIAALGLVSQIGQVCSSQFTPTGTYRAPTFPGMCQISLKAWGWIDAGDTKNGYIKVNGVTYFDSFSANFDYRGFDLVTLDTTTCKASNFGRFDLNEVAADSDRLATYIANQPDGTHILGVTSDSAFYALQNSARVALMSIGVDITGYANWDKVLFYAVKGHPEKTFARLVKAGGGSLYYDEKPGLCDVSMKAWGWTDTGDTRNSYIKVNGVVNVDSFNGNTAYRGFDLVTLDTSTCKASNFGRFDLNEVAVDSDRLANYIANQPDGTHILGVTSDSAFYALQNSARVALKSIGVDITGYANWDKVLFHAVKGRPQETFARLVKAGGGSIYYEEQAVCKNGGILKIDKVAGFYQCECASEKYYGDFCEQVEEAWLYK